MFTLYIARTCEILILSIMVEIIFAALIFILMGAFCVMFAVATGYAAVGIFLCVVFALALGVVLCEEFEIF